MRPQGRYVWWTGFAIGLGLVSLLLISMATLVAIGIGLWGVMIPVAWGFAITSFVWWIGIGHAGTLISAILFLLKQQWRTSINRFAEAMTIFAVIQAGQYPLFHLGRPWFFYWLVPYPATMNVWPQFRSPLIWDFFAVSTYFTVSLIFWYLGMVPDLASVRDRATGRTKQVIYGVLALGWRGSARHWHRYEQVYYLLAALATPLVVSVHSVVSTDFAVGIVQGWHETIFPPYFVAGALFSGFAMVLTISIPLRVAFNLQDFVTLRHLDIMAKFTLVTGLVVDYSYLLEHFMGWYSGNEFELLLISNRAFGPYALWYWLVLICNIGVNQMLWFKRVRTTPWLLFWVSIVINVGMWLERFMIVVGSLERDYLPSSWGVFTPTFWDWSFLFGTLGLFTSLMFLFARFLPMIPAFEMRRMLRELWLGRRG
ncbi:MAG: polysulfide reductase NrfD [Chloroflexi bacterium]|nr:polysulfide reductase NrfD [Chloroflexota bacterium]MBV9542780.1 polysulfide reductase NrfD [Chloroflexota bacterium]